MKQPKQRLIHVGDAPIRIQRKHSVGNAFQNGFDMPAPLFQRNVSGAQSWLEASICRRLDSNSSAMRLKERTRSPISSAALTSTR